MMQYLPALLEALGMGGAAGGAGGTGALTGGMGGAIGGGASQGGGGFLSSLLQGAGMKQGMDSQKFMPFLSNAKKYSSFYDNEDENKQSSGQMRSAYPNRFM